jgi:PAS domain S-box-containing protein
MNEKSQKIKKKRLFTDFVRTLSMTMDFEEGEKLSHAGRVAVLSWYIGNEMNYPNPGNLYYSGLLHDIGGINLDNHILHYVSSTKIDPRAYNHPHDGAKILSPFKPFEPFIPLIKNHHEHFDGTGFPQGLTEESIPLGASIILMADLLDVNFRDNNDLVDSQKAIKLIEKFSGHEIFPAVADATIRLLNKRADLLLLVFSDSLQRLLYAINPEPQNLDGISHVDLLTQLLWVFARIIDSKHSHSMGHSVRTTWLACRISEELPDQSVNKWDLIWASLLHDAGELGVPKRILNKPSKLTPFEWMAIKKHTLDTINILSSIKDLEHLASSAGSNHEWFDGSGYPYEKSGEDIPFIGRIIALADVYDAMRSVRPYRAAMSHIEAREKIEELSGKQFDPVLAEAALDVFDKFGDDAMNLDILHDDFFNFFEKDDVSVNNIINQTSGDVHTTVMNGGSGVLLLQLEGWKKLNISEDFNIVEGIEYLKSFSSKMGEKSLTSWFDMDSRQFILKLKHLKEGEVETKYLFLLNDAPLEAVFIKISTGFTFMFRSAKNRIETFKGLSHFYRNFLSSSEAVLFTDIEGKITDTNRKFLDLYGYKIKEIIGKHITILHPKNLQESFEYKDMWKAVLDNKTGHWSGEITTLSSKGKRIIIILSVSSIKDASGKLLGYINNAVDVTEKKLAEENLKLREKELSESNEKLKKMNNLKSDMVSITSHDLKSPVNTILTIAGFLKENLDTMGMKQIKYFIDQIEAKGEKSIRFISEMLDLAKMETSNYGIISSRVNVRDLANIVIKDFKQQAEYKQLKINYIEPEKDLYIYADAPKLLQVFDNLLGNAIKFSPQHGVISLICKITKDAKLEVIVEDNGSGVKEEDLEAIFEKYYQSGKESNEQKRGFGSGLGLYIVKNIIIVHGGEVWAEQILTSENIVTGTRMIFELPLFHNSNGILCFDLPPSYREYILKIFSSQNLEFYELNDNEIIQSIIEKKIVKTVFLGAGAIGTEAIKNIGMMEKKDRPFTILLRKDSEPRVENCPCSRDLSLPFVENELLMLLKEANNENTK